MVSRRFFGKLAALASAMAFVWVLPGCGESTSSPPPSSAPAPAPEASQDVKTTKTTKGKHKKFADDDMGIREKREQRRKEAAAAQAQ